MKLTRRSAKSLLFAGIMVAACLAIAACSLLPDRTQPDATAFPTPQALRVGFSASISPVRSALNRCAQAHREVSLFVTETPGSFQPWPLLEGTPVDLLIRFGLEDQFKGFAVRIATESIAVIVPAGSAVKQLSAEQLRGLFSGQIQSWEQVGGSGEVKPYIFPEGDEARVLFDAAILGDEPASAFARLAPDPESMLESISTEPGSIGYLPSAWLGPQVRSIILDPQLRSTLTQPVLALSQREPIGSTRSFLSCLQVGDGQKELEKIFPLNHK